MSEERSADARVVSRVVGTGGEALAHVTERVRALRGVSHPGVLTPAGLGVTDSDQVVVRFPWLDGVDLAELETRRGPLSAGECVWLGVRVAQALEQMHAAGLPHGDLSPGNVVIANGSVVLVDTVAGCLDGERGTVGFRAPEREEHGASVAGDVFSLGALLRWCVAKGQRVAIEAWTAPLLVADPASRPPVDVAQQALASCAMEQELVVPARPEMVTAVRTRATERTVRITGGSTSKWRRLGLRVGLGLAVGAAVMAVAVVVPKFVDGAKPAGADAAQGVGESAAEAGAAVSPPAVEGPTVSPSPALDAGQAAAELTEQRFAALASGDDAQLLATVAEGSLADEVQALSTALAAGQVRYEGLDVAVGDVQVVAESPHSAVVHVAYDVSEHVVVTQSGERAVAAYTQEVELELIRDGVWTVQAARPTP